MVPSFFSAIKAQAWVESSIFCLIQWYGDFKFGFKLKGSVVFFIYFQCQSWPIVMSGMDLIGIAQVRNSTLKPCLTATSVIWSPHYYGHFFSRLAKTALHFLVKFNHPVNMAIFFFGPLVTVLTMFHCKMIHHCFC